MDIGTFWTPHGSLLLSVGFVAAYSRNLLAMSFLSRCEAHLQPGHVLQSTRHLREYQQIQLASPVLARQIVS